MKSCDKALVSIIVPVYNVAPYIKECIESIQRQTCREIEIIAVDDGSMDGSGRICEEIAAQDSRIKVIYQKNAGVVSARSRGFEESVGKYILFVDGDDWIESDMLECLIKKIKDSDLVTSGVYYQETADRTIKRCDEFPEGTYSGETQMDGFWEAMLYDSALEYVQRLTPWIFNKLYRSDLVKEIYGEVNPDITFAEDSVFLYKYLLKCRSVSITHRCYYHYRYRRSSATHVVNRHMLMDINRVYLSLEIDFKNHRLGKSLLFQLQRWIMVMSCRAVNSHMGFSIQAQVMEFIADVSCLRNKKVVLYGAGKVGRDTYAQLKKFHYSIVLWADKNYKFYQNNGLQVSSPEAMLSTEYDVIFVAVRESALAEKIRGELLNKGISEEKVVWKEPMRVFD